MQKTSYSVTIGSDVPYAKPNNDGYRGSVNQHVSAHTRRKTKLGIVKSKQLKTKTNIKYGRVTTGTIDVKAHDRTIHQNIPRRRYIGQSQYLNKQVERIISSEIMKSFK